MRRVLAAGAAGVAAVAIAVAGCTHGSQSSPKAGKSAAATGGTGLGVAEAGQGGVRWHDCTPGNARLLCGSLQVPLDYARPAGRKITLALQEVPATAPASKRLGVLLFNPGGPGAPGTGWPSYIAHYPGLGAVAARYDIVGFDTRGVGASRPELTCDPSFFARERPNYIPANAAAEQVLIDRAKMYAADCEKRFGWLLPYMTTVNIARDMDRIRAALGQRQVNYFGISYGTYIGQVYATLFPHRVHRMVLDSTVDPAGAWYADNIAQDYAFQGRLDAFFAWVAKYNSLYHMGTTAAQVKKSWYEVRNRLITHPILDPGGPNIGPSEYDDTFLQGGYLNSLWPALAAADATYLRSGSTGDMLSDYRYFGVQNENEFAVYNAVECADVAWPRSWAYWNSDTRKVYAKAPYLAWDNAWFNAACAFWPVHGPARPMRIGAPGLPGILMLQGTLDAATPYAGAQVAHRMLPTARMVVVVGGGNHGQSLEDPPNTCVNGYLVRYLLTGALPTRPGLVNATCPALPDPVPSG